MPEPYEADCRAELRQQVAAVAQFTEAELAAKSRAELEAKFTEYAAAAEQLEQAVVQANEDYVVVAALYDQVFQKVELVEVLAERLAGLQLAPIPVDATAAAGEDFDELNVAIWVVEGIGGLEFLASLHNVYKWRQAKKAAQAAGAAAKLTRTAAVGSAAGAGGAAGSAAAALAARTSGASAGSRGAAAAAKVKPVKFPAGGIALGVLGVAAAGAGIYMNIKNDRQLMAFYRDNLRGYAEWFASAEQAYLLYCAARRSMRTQIDDLKAALGLTQDDAGDIRLKEILDQSLVGAGEFEAKLTAAERMLCSDLSVDDVIRFTALPDETEVRDLLAARQIALLAGNKAQCRARYPDLPI